VCPTDYVVGLVFTTVNGSGHSSQVSYSGTGLVIALPHIFTKERKVAKERKVLIPSQHT